MSVVTNAKALLKQLLPGNPQSISFGINFSIGMKSPSRKPPIFKHEPAKKLQGWPGSYYSWPTSFFNLGPLNVSIYWKPFDRLSEEEYFAKYGTHGNVEPTQWDLLRKERRAKAALDKINVR